MMSTMFMSLWKNWRCLPIPFKGLYYSSIHHYIRVKFFLDSHLVFSSRWDVKAVKDLPEYLKLCFLALYNTVNEMVYDTLKEQGVDILTYLTKAACIIYIYIYI